MRFRAVTRSKDVRPLGCAWYNNCHQTREVERIFGTLGCMVLNFQNKHNDGWQLSFQPASPPRRLPGMAIGSSLGDWV